MLSLLRRLAKNIPSFILAFALAIAVWISAVTASDPNVENVYAHPVTITYLGQDPSLLIMGEPQRQVTVTLRAPQSIWEHLNTDLTLVKAQVDLSGLGAGEHHVPVQVDVGIRPVQITKYLPDNVTVDMEPLTTQVFKIQLVVSGEPSVGFQADTPVLDSATTSISGPASLVARVSQVHASLDLTNVKDNIHQILKLQADDTNGLPVIGLTLTPDQITVTANVTQRGGYRNLVVKVIVNGQIASGFRLSNIFVYPPIVTVFSTNPSLVENMPGYVETVPINLNGARDGLDLQAKLNLPEQVQLVGDQTVNVQVAITAIEGSLTLSNMKVDIIGLDANLAAQISPDKVDVILSGPLYLLDQLTASQVTVVIDLTGRGAGTYQLVPKVILANSNIIVESILPGTVEVTIINVTPTPTPTLNKTITPTPTPTPYPTPLPTPTP